MAEAREISPVDPTLIDDDDDDSEGWSEMDVESESSLSCLFCTHTFKTMAVALEHCKSDHDFDLIALKKRFSMDCYSYICFVNYVRREGVRPDQIKAYSTAAWASESNLAPVLPDDPWLMFDFEGLESPFYSRTVSPEPATFVVAENGAVTMTEENFLCLQQTIKQLKTQVHEKEAALQLAAEQMQQIQSVTRKLIDDSEDLCLDKSVSKLRITEDHSYFSSYSHVGIHHQMLTDQPRTNSYKNAIFFNQDIITGKVVLDIGCGSGILSMFCVQAGAGKVVGVDQSEVIYHAMDIIRENGMEQKIELIKGRVEEVALPMQKVDIIVSEWMGYFLLFEGMLDSVILARDKFLAPGGIMLPNRSTIHLIGISDPDDYQENVQLWSDVYGFKMTTFRLEVLEEAHVLTVPPAAVATTPSLVLDLNLNTCDISSTNFTADFGLQCTRSCSLTGICGYFDVTFDLPTSVVLSTSPLSEKTHWRQAVFYLPEPIPVTEGDVLMGKICCRRKSKDNRSLVIELSIQGKVHTYYVA